MQDNLRAPNPQAKSFYDQNWSVGQQWFVHDPGPHNVVHALLPDSYKYSVIAGRPWRGESVSHSSGGEIERKIDDRERVKHVLIVAGPLGEDGVCADHRGVVADLTAVFTPGRFLPQVRSPRLDADLGEYICKLHNDELARKQAAKAE